MESRVDLNPDLLFLVEREGFELEAFSRRLSREPKSWAQPRTKPIELVRNRCERSSRLLHAMLAEREGFEPPIPLRVCLISSQVHSTGLCHLSAF
jgi:hypothetical protein